MPDAFFASNKNRKRKRSASADQGPSSSKKPARGAASGRGGKAKRNAPAPAKAKHSKRDEELSDETQDEEGMEAVDEMDLRAPDVDPNAYESDEEDEDETPAEKRLRLAKLYLDGVKEGLGLGEYNVYSIYLYCNIYRLSAEGEFDAAEIDKELISARLKQDVMEHAGKVHLFVADSVSPSNRSNPRFH